MQAAVAADAPAQAAARPPGARPRIGLVLGGGGAKGAAHIGVIKVLEEMRIPVDCIAGTSMGSIVGAAYATGISSQQLEQIITAVNWKDILASAPRQDIPVHRKDLDFVFTNGLELGVKDGGIVTPSGLVPTHQIEALFRRIVAGAGQVPDFDHLPIPFRAVATDLESGQMKVFDRGDLAMAMRASMAVPAAFAPVDYQGHLYVDGMLVRNVPVDVARKICGDVIIAVPVSNPALTRKNLTTFLGVAGQAMNIAIEANEKAQLATLTDKDVEIPVVLQDIGSSDFAKVPEAIPIGEAAAHKFAASLARYSLSPREYAEWRAHLRTLAERPPEKVDQVRIAGLKVTNPEVVQTFVQTKPGDTFDPKKADADTNAIVARGDYTVASYEVDTEGGGNVLTYTATEKPWGPNYLMFDLNLNTDLHGDTGWGIRLDMQNRWLNSLGGELRTSFQLGRPNAFAAEFYQPLDVRQRFFVAPSVFAYQTVTYLYDDSDRVAQLDSRRYGMRVDGGMALDSWGELRAGLLRGNLGMKTLIGSPVLPDSGWSALGAVTARFVVDTYDLRLFPTSGTYAQLNGYFSTTALGADRTYQTLDARWSKVLTWDRDVVTFALRGGTNFSSSVPFYDQFKGGGLFNFSGYRNNELIGREYAFGSVQYRRRLGYLQETLGTAAWGGGTLEAGNVYQRLDGVPSQGLLAGGSLFVAVNSKLGPVYFGYGLSQGGHAAFYLMIGSSLDVF